LETLSLRNIHDGEAVSEASRTPAYFFFMGYLMMLSVSRQYIALDDRMIGET
jgi:hypothetical protein